MPEESSNFNRVETWKNYVPHFRGTTARCMQCLGRKCWSLYASYSPCAQVALHRGLCFEEEHELGAAAWSQPWGRVRLWGAPPGAACVRVSRGLEKKDKMQPYVMKSGIQKLISVHQGENCKLWLEDSTEEHFSIQNKSKQRKTL